MLLFKPHVAIQTLCCFTNLMLLFKVVYDVFVFSFAIYFVEFILELGASDWLCVRLYFWPDVFHIKNSSNIQECLLFYRALSSLFLRCLSPPPFPSLA
jgi:hypothetical protein